MAKPMSTKRCLLGRWEEQGCLPRRRGGRKRQTPELARATTGSLRSPVVRGGAARSFHQVLEMRDGTQLGKATPGCLKHGAKDVLFLLRMCDLRCHNWFTSASHIPSLGLAFLVCEMGRQAGRPLHSLDGLVGGREGRPGPHSQARQPAHDAEPSSLCSLWGPAPTPPSPDADCVL